MAHVHGAASAAEMGKSAAKAAGQGMMGESMPEMMGKGMAVTGAAAMVGTHAVRSVVGNILKHPLVLFGLGVAVGYTVHKYRKEIIGSANRVAEKGKDFVLQQRENLEDLVGETPESES
jgi:hypothetical protein